VYESGIFGYNYGKFKSSRGTPGAYYIVGFTGSDIAMIIATGAF